MDVETATSFNFDNNFDFLLDNQLINTTTYFANLVDNNTQATPEPSIIDNVMSNENFDFDIDFLLNSIDDHNATSAQMDNSNTQLSNCSSDELLAEILLNDMNSVSSVNSNVSSPIYDLSSPSNHSNESDVNSILESFAVPASSMAKIIVYNDNSKSSNEIILNINDIGMECLKNKMKDSSNNESRIELESEYDSDEDVGPTKKLELTEEEKTLFKKEGYEIPKHLPLTKNEEKILKLIRRKIRNKQSAHLSRERKKYYVEGLEKRVDVCTKENQMLQKQIKQLREQNSELSTKLQKMQACLVALYNKSNKVKLSTTVLFLSFFMTFCVYPLFDSSKTSIDGTMSTSIQIVPYTGGNSRTLMSADEINTSLPNETKTGFLTSFWGFSTSWDPYNKYRYDI